MRLYIYQIRKSPKTSHVKRVDRNPQRCSIDMIGSNLEMKIHCYGVIAKCRLAPLCLGNLRLPIICQNIP